MDRNLCRQLAPALPSLEEIDAEAQARFPDDESRRNIFADGWVRGCYHSARVMVLMGAGEPEEEDEEDGPDLGNPIALQRIRAALPVDDEAVSYDLPTDEERIMSEQTMPNWAERAKA